MFLKLNSQDLFIYALNFFTIVIVLCYVYAYFMAETKYGNKYIPLLATSRALLLAGFLIIFYNPLRSEFDYGRSLPFFAFSAGVSLLLLLDKYEVLNLVHFLLYGNLLPDNPKKTCGLVEANGSVHVPAKV